MFIYQKLPELLEMTALHLKASLIDYFRLISHNSSNTTVTLSTRKGNAQPWRFFYACMKAQGNNNA